MEGCILTHYYFDKYRGSREQEISSHSSPFSLKTPIGLKVSAHAGGDHFEEGIHEHRGDKKPLDLGEFFLTCVAARRLTSIATV